MALTDGVASCYSPGIKGSGYLLSDLGPRRNNATLLNMDSTDWVGAPNGVMLDFVAASQQEAKAAFTPITITNQATISIWARYATGANLSFSRIFCFGNASPTRFFYITYMPSEGRFGSGVFNGSMDYYADGMITTAANTISHVVAVFGADSLRLFVNGRADTVRSIPAGYSIGLITQSSVGRLPNYSQFANCQIGECVFWNRAVSHAEAIELYRSGNGAIGRMLTGQTRRPSYGNGARFKAAWARGSNALLGFQQP